MPDERRQLDGRAHDRHLPYVAYFTRVRCAALERDRATKRNIYAAAGIHWYIIINIPERRIEMFQQGGARVREYAPPTILHRDDILRLPHVEPIYRELKDTFIRFCLEPDSDLVGPRVHKGQSVGDVIADCIRI